MIDRLTDPEDVAAVARITMEVARLGELLVEAGLEPQLAVRVLMGGVLHFGDNAGVSRAVALAMIQKLHHMGEHGPG